MTALIRDDLRLHTDSGERTIGVQGGSADRFTGPCDLAIVACAESLGIDLPVIRTLRDLVLLVGHPG